MLWTTERDECDKENEAIAIAGFCELCIIKHFIECAVHGDSRHSIVTSSKWRQSSSTSVDGQPVQWAIHACGEKHGTLSNKIGWATLPRLQENHRENINNLLIMILTMEGGRIYMHLHNQAVYKQCQHHFDQNGRHK